MTVRIHAGAREDFFNAVDHFSEISNSVCTAFIDEFESCIRNIETQPTAWTPIQFDCRRCLFRSFKYSIIYRIDGTDIIILAVMHNSRNPYYWIKR